MECLKRYLENEFSTSEIHYWDKSLVSEYGCDLILTARDRDYFIELKASKRHPYKDNLRMTPSIITKCANKGVLDKLIIALVTDVFNAEEQHVCFIPFSNIESEKLFVDVKFGFKPHHVKAINFSSIQVAENNLQDKHGVSSHLQCTLAEKLGIK